MTELKATIPGVKIAGLTASTIAQAVRYSQQLALQGRKNPYSAAALIEEDNSLATITTNTPGNTTVQYDYFDYPELFRFNGTLNVNDLNGGAQPDQLNLAGNTSGGNTARGFDTVNVQVSVCTDAPEIVFRLLNVNVFCVKVEEEGQPARFISKTPTSLSNGGFQSLNVNFGSRKRRIVTACAPRENGFALQGVRATEIDTFWPIPSSKKVAFITDSFGMGLNLNAGGQYWPDIVADAFEWDNYLPSCLSGTGFLNPSANNYYTFVERIPQIAAWAPEKVVVNLSINDAAYTETEVTDAVTQFIDDLTAALPGVEIIIIGALGRTQANYKTLEEWGIAAIEAHAYNNIKFVPVQTVTTYMEGWINGTGEAGNTTGDGNADVYIQSDTRHPTIEGQAYIASRIIQGMLEAGVIP